MAELVGEQGDGQQDREGKATAYDPAGLMPSTDSVTSSA